MQLATKLKHYYFEKYILDVAIATLERGGATSRVDTYQFLAPIDAWGFPKYPGKTAILAPDSDLTEGLAHFIQANHTSLCEPDAWLGTWINPRTHCCYLDITAIYPYLEEARQEAFRLSQQESRSVMALYNFKHDQVIYLESELPTR